MKLSINKIYRSYNDKNGKPLMTKDGRPYERVAIQTKEHGSSWLSGFGGGYNRNWKVGDVVEVEVEQDGQYLNFKRPDPIKKLKERVLALEQVVFKSSVDEEIDDEIKAEDIPF